MTEIANQDYRGNCCSCSSIAAAALAEFQGVEQDDERRKAAPRACGGRKGLIRRTGEKNGRSEIWAAK